ncbi:hypothetical protein PV326_005711 [Microctonus aethiopoides]|uniref:Proline-rich protein PRCC n=1 Tax=Microctonus aethiopoides TaxID=144406 RepID=A0AA39FI71_9HYME|nr:hypothetical protein PV326_005711 [Microctonus aethiopoides]KAK0169896.1 hypothetical protein PV328_010530 [Microctonus aethiopoides]
MSLTGLVQYDSSDDSNEEIDNEEISESIEKINISLQNKVNEIHKDESKAVNTIQSGRKLLLPDPIQLSERLETNISDVSVDNSSKNLFLNSLPKPKATQIDEEFEEDDIIPVPKVSKFVIEKPPKKPKGPVKISIPSLSDFDDIDETSNKKIKAQSSKKLCGVLALLPPPKDEMISTNKLIPDSIVKATKKNPSSLIPTQIKKNSQSCSNVQGNIKPKLPKSSHALSSLNYDSNSDDEDEDNTTNNENSTIDFFSLSKPVNQQLSEEIFAANILPVSDDKIKEPEVLKKVLSENIDEGTSTTLTSTVMNLPKDEIMLKNKAEVGPKLPVPEQEYNIDAGGNVAFDDKAIEYLCGKRGVKRKNQIVNENEIIDINGEDIKPDEREWLVKALTEEPVRRPVSIGSGPSSQSKKKHQITYLAHQAKAMEIELQNQWASSNLARKQTRSKYGF